MDPGYAYIVKSFNWRIETIYVERYQCTVFIDSFYKRCVGGGSDSSVHVSPLLICWFEGIYSMFSCGWPLYIRAFLLVSFVGLDL